jgi:hypothetical protein
MAARYSFYFGTGLSSTKKSGQRSNGYLSPDPSNPEHMNALRGQKSTTGLKYIWRAAHDIIDNQLNCEEIWSRYCAENTTPGKPYRPEDRRRNVRINVDIPGERPDLDNLDSLEKMEQLAKRSAERDPLILEVAHRLVASCFYFEKLDPGYQNRESGESTCHGKQQPVVMAIRY